MAKKTDPCWDGYTQVGMKMKNGKKVPNCVPAKGVPKSKPKKKVSKQMCASCGCKCTKAKAMKGCKCSCNTCKTARSGKKAK